MPRPDFIILGAMKAGTTSLYECCNAHPQIGMSRLKETDFFISRKNWTYGMNWYERQFPEGFGRTGEASPNYTKLHSFPGVPARIAETLPDCRFIFLARDPISRAESQYRHAVLSGAKMPPPKALPHSRAFDHLVSVSSYAFQIQLYLEYFSRDRFLFLDFNEMAHTPQTALTKVAAFLEVENCWQPVAQANSTVDLAQMPKWVFRCREGRAAHWVKRHIPRHILTSGLKMLRRSRPRSAPAWPESLRHIFADALRDDAQLFRKISGLDFADWSV